MVLDPDLPSLDSAGRRFLDWTPLVRAIGLAADGRKLILGVAGLAVLLGGWRLLDGVFGFDPETTWRIVPGETIQLLEPNIRNRWTQAAWLVSEPARTVVGPFVDLFSREVGIRLWLKSLAMGIWSLIVWGIVGGAIARIAVVQLTVGGRVGIASALRFAVRNWAALVGAPLTPFLAVSLIAGGCGAFGLLYRIPAGIGATIAGIFGFVPLVAGLLMALILLGLGLGWPLMHATVATEGEDVADALSRSYSYVNQRLIRYLVHLAASWILGIVGLVAALVVAQVVLSLADWSVALGAPATRPVTIPLADITREFWTRLVGWLTHAYMYSYFWSTIIVIYLILRRDIDGTDPHDVFLPDQAADPFADGADLIGSDLMRPSVGEAAGNLEGQIVPAGSPSSIVNEA